MKIFLIFAATMFVILNSSAQLFSQQNKSVGISKTEVINTPAENTKISEITKNLKIARTNGDISTKEFWEKKLNEITKPQIIEIPQNIFVGKRETGNENITNDFLSVSKLGNWWGNALAISYDRVKGDIYAAIGQISNVNPIPEADTLRILKSTNNGLSFSLIYTFTMPGNFRIPQNSLDMEVISNGDSSFAFIGISYTLGGLYNSGIIRVRQDGNLASFGLLQGSITNKFYNARITSDNAYYTNSTYIYFSATLDSTVSGNRRVKSKLYRIDSPFSTPLRIISAYQDNSNGQYGYYIDGIAPSNAEFESDIAFVNTAGDSDQVYTVTVVRGVAGSFNDGASLYFTKSDNYGRTVPTLFSQTESGSYLKKSPRIAATGYRNSSLVVFTRRLFQNGDWDPFNFYCSNINAPVPSFTGTYISGTTDTTVAISVAAKYRSNGTYLFGYCNRTFQGYSGNIFINLFTSGVYGGSVQVNNTTAAGERGLPDVTFRNVNNDSCLSLWAGYDGFGVYLTRGCSGPFIGINNQSSIADNFMLEQNYPNPFNPVTNIKFDIRKSGFVSLKVFDILGNEVENLVNENKTAGSYSVTFDGSKLASGVYYYRMESGDYTETKRMSLLK
ncbi:MAG: T9SS type A sorting domain-containing protein [Bacteroidetes bacterium]|nr:T9SS type A sorting domain-containing protein [Bacteroidota bacterium]